MLLFQPLESKIKSIKSANIGLLPFLIALDLKKGSNKLEKKNLKILLFLANFGYRWIIIEQSNNRVLVKFKTAGVLEDDFTKNLKNRNRKNISECKIWNIKVFVGALT